MNILILEDDPLLAECLSLEIQSLGDKVIGPFSDMQGALRHVDSAQGAILDIMVNDGPSFAVADMMAANNQPFLFLTGYDQDELPLRFHRSSVYSKPSAAQPLLQELHSQYFGHRGSKPDELQDIVLDMLAYARLKMPDTLSAERLVEAAMKTAIHQVEQGKCEADLRSLLVGLLEQEAEGARCRHLQ